MRFQFNGQRKAIKTTRAYKPKATDISEAQLAQGMGHKRKTADNFYLSAQSCDDHAATVDYIMEATHDQPSTSTR